jgi:hypothetical protein
MAILSVQALLQNFFCWILQCFDKTLEKTSASKALLDASVPGKLAPAAHRQGARTILNPSSEEETT